MEVLNQMASLGGLRRESICRWREGRVLKKARPGMMRVWRILGLVLRQWGDGKGSVMRIHCHGAL